MSDWKTFGQDHLSGTYWVRGTRPVYDVDVNDYGDTVGQATGESEEFVALVEIEFDGDNLEVYEVSRSTGAFDDDCGISHYMEFSIPSFSSPRPAPDFLAQALNEGGGIYRP